MNEAALLKAVCSVKQYPEPFLLAKVRLSLEATELLLIAYHSYFLSAVILAFTPGFGPPANTVHLLRKMSCAVFF